MRVESYLEPIEQIMYGGKMRAYAPGQLHIPYPFFYDAQVHTDLHSSRSTRNERSVLRQPGGVLPAEVLLPCKNSVEDLAFITISTDTRETSHDPLTCSPVHDLRPKLRDECRVDPSEHEKGMKRGHEGYHVLG